MVQRRRHPSTARLTGRAGADVHTALKGGVIVGDDEKAHEPFYTLVLSQDANETGVKLSAAEDGTEFVLVRGRPVPGLPPRR